MLAGSATGGINDSWNADSPGDWFQTANWLTNTIPNGPGDVAIINAPPLSTGGSFSLQNPVRLGWLYLEVEQLLANVIFLSSGGPLIMDNQGLTAHVIQNSIFRVDINCDIVLTEDTIFDWNGQGFISGDISGPGDFIFDGTLTSTGGVANLWGNNTYTGETIVRKGSLSFQFHYSLGATDMGTRVESGATLRMTNHTNPTISSDHITLENGGHFLLRDCTWNSDLTLSGGGRLGPEFDGNNVTFNGKVAGNGGLTRASAQSSNGSESVFTLGNTANDYAGGTTIEGGVLRIAADGALGESAGGITFDKQGFSEGEPALTTVADITIPRAVSLLDTGWFRTSGGTTATYSGVISGGAGLRINEGGYNGSVELTGANTYAGSTHLRSGTLLINNITGSAAGTGPVNTSGNTTLGGTGAISGALNLANGATIAPGNSTGTLTVGGINMSEASTIAIEIGGTATGAFDQLVVTDEAALDGTLVVSLLPKYTPVEGDTFEIITAATITGALAETMLPDDFVVEQTAGAVTVVYAVAPDCSADLANDDSLVNVFDLLELLAGWGSDGAGADLAEPNDLVDVFDLLALLAGWGPCE